MRIRYSFSSKRTGHIDNIEKQRRKFPEIAEEIVKISDIILEVLDARFFQETRNIELEEEIKIRGKKLIYVLNKCDTADVNEKKKELKALKLYPYVFVSCRKRIGGNLLRNRIKIEAKRVTLPEEGMKRVQVGIIGYPNTGKSSLINLLTGTSSAGVGSAAGFTKGMQKVKLTSDIIILDTPGVIPLSEYSNTNMEAISKHAKVNARDYAKVRNPEYVVTTLLRDFTKQIDKFYQTHSEGDSEKLIEELGRKKNLLRKGGVVDEDRTARIIIRDWQEGKIKI